MKTRSPVILEADPAGSEFAAGDTFEDLLGEFPDLQREDLLASLEFAAQSLKLKSQHLVLA